MSVQETRMRNAPIFRLFVMAISVAVTGCVTTGSNYEVTTSYSHYVVTDGNGRNHHHHHHHRRGRDGYKLVVVSDSAGTKHHHHHHNTFEIKQSQYNDIAKAYPAKHRNKHRAVHGANYKVKSRHHHHHKHR